MDAQPIINKLFPCDYPHICYQYSKHLPDCHANHRPLAEQLVDEVFHAHESTAITQRQDLRTAMVQKAELERRLALVQQVRDLIYAEPDSILLFVRDLLDKALAGKPVGDEGNHKAVTWSPGD